MTKKEMENIVVGNIYYKQSKSDCKSCYTVQVVEILNEKQVLVKGLKKSKKGKKEAQPFITSVFTLHTNPLKAVSGYKQHHKRKKKKKEQRKMQIKNKQIS